jgi:hypothetical protein
MIIKRTANTVIIKRTIDSIDHVRIGVLRVALWKDGTARSIGLIGKPHNEHTIADCADLLDKLESLP